MEQDKVYSGFSVTPVDACMIEFLSQRSPIYVELHKIRQEISENPEADDYFQRLRKSGDTATPNLKIFFQRQMCQIAKEMNSATQFLTDIEAHRKKELRAPPPKVLDLCMAPGGFSEYVRQSLCPLTEINGITLPLALGGHELLLKTGPRLKVEFLDITMLAAEMGFDIIDIPSDHPDRDLFFSVCPFFNQKFDLILCDGQVLRTHKRQEYREKIEAVRLRVSQSTFALQHIKSGGTFVMLLHNAECAPTFKLIYEFNKFSSSIELFKPTTGHKMRSSFYLVAKGVNPHSDAALSVIEEWKQAWASSTLHFSTWEGEQTTDDDLQHMLADFGEKFIQICEPMWKIQTKALYRKLKQGFSTTHLTIR